MASRFKFDRGYKSPYTDTLRELFPSLDPYLVEEEMRLTHSTLDHLTKTEFNTLARSSAREVRKRGNR